MPGWLGCHRHRLLCPVPFSVLLSLYIGTVVLSCLTCFRVYTRSFLSSPPSAFIACTYMGQDHSLLPTPPSHCVSSLPPPPPSFLGRCAPYCLVFRLIFLLSSCYVFVHSLFRPYTLVFTTIHMRMHSFLRQDKSAKTTLGLCLPRETMCPFIHTGIPMAWPDRWIDGPMKRHPTSGDPAYFVSV